MKRIGYIVILACCIISCSGCSLVDKLLSEKATTEQAIPEEDVVTEAITMETITMQEVTTETVTEMATTEDISKHILIAIDPGHQASSVDMSASEPNAPGSDVMKTKATGGTTGNYTGVPEYQLNLDISMMLKERLIAQGYDVIMTREDNETAISNSERAMLANENGADIAVRIHANGSEDASVNGALVLVGSADNAYVGHLYGDSYRLAESVLDHYCQATGMKNLGIQTNDTMTGINWSEIPVIILEMGFMSNEQDDWNMQDWDYQDRMVDGIVDGINAYYGFETIETEASTTDTKMGELEKLLEQEAQGEEAKGTEVSVYVERLEDAKTATYGVRQMRAASLIKLFIAGCVYEQQESMELSDDKKQELEYLIENMITISDNDATNALVRWLGDGDANAGMDKVNVYCQQNGYNDSFMGRLMLDFSSTSENYTSVKDCAAILKRIWQGDMTGSDRLLSYLKQQDRTGKIPAGIPDGVITGNKTGELEDVENDAAIIMSEENPYIMCVMTDEMGDTAAGREWIVQLSSKVYEKLQ